MGTSRHQHNELLKQQRIEDLISSEKTRQAEFRLDSEKSKTGVARIGAEVSKVQLSIAGEGLQQTRHQLSAAKLSTQQSALGVESAKLALQGAKDSVGFEKAKLAIDRQLKLEQLKGLNSQCFELSQSNAQKIEELRALYGNAPRIKSLGGGI